MRLTAVKHCLSFSYFTFFHTESQYSVNDYQVCFTTSSPDNAFTHLVLHQVLFSFFRWIRLLLYCIQSDRLSGQDSFRKAPSGLQPEERAGAADCPASESNPMKSRLAEITCQLEGIPKNQQNPAISYLDQSDTDTVYTAALPAERIACDWVDLLSNDETRIKNAFRR